jgi:UDP-glucose 4-epimerase
MTGQAPLTWVVGGGGLLGSHVVSQFSPESVWTPGAPMAWGTTDAGDQLTRSAHDFLSAAGDRPWQVAWCAGSGVTGTSAATLAAETTTFERMLEALARAPRPEQGGFFLASSAGGVYAGSPSAPHDELTEPRALSPYGEAKLELERRLADWHARVGVSVLVGRISNLYGPGQNLGKPQGLISHVVRAALLGLPTSVYVPLDTVRDNLFVSDAGRLVRTGLETLRAETATRGPRLVTKVIASQQPVTVGFLIAELGRILKRRPRVVYRPSAVAAFQARDLRMRSVVWPELDREPLVPLPVGMRRTVQALGMALAAGDLR